MGLSRAVVLVPSIKDAILGREGVLKEIRSISGKPFLDDISLNVLLKEPGVSNSLTRAS